MPSQDDILSIKRVAAYSLNAIDPTTGDNEKKAALGVLYQRAYELFRAEHLSLPEKLLEDGGILSGANTALFYRPVVPKTENFDPEDWNWSKIPLFDYKEVALNIDNEFKVQRRYNEMDIASLKNRFASGNYEYVASYVMGLIKYLLTAGAMKRNSLIMENIVDQARNNGIITIEVPKGFGVKNNTTAYSARQIYLDPVMQRLANMKKLIDYSQGILGTSDPSYTLLVSENFIYTLLQVLSIQGSDKSFSSLVTGKLTEIFGIPVINVPYLDNIYSVSEVREEQDGKWIPIATEVDLKGVDAILLHRNAFVYKFGPPFFKDQAITGSTYRVLTHIQRFPTKRLPILGKYCIGFKWVEEGQGGDLPGPDNPDQDHSPTDWTQRSYKNLTFVWDKDKDKITIGDSECWKPSEDWANNEGGIEDHKNWFEFIKEFGNKRGQPVSLKRLVIWDKTSWGYRYCVPVAWETSTGLNRIELKTTTKEDKQNHPQPKQGN